MAVDWTAVGCDDGSVRKSLLVRILDAGTTYIDERLYGFVLVRRRNSEESRYLIPLPRFGQPCPPGWDSVESATGVTSEEVQDAWAEDLTSNAAAERAFEALRNKRHLEWVGHEVLSFDQMTALEFAPLTTPGSTPADALTEERPSMVPASIVLRPGPAPVMECVLAAGTDSRSCIRITLATGVSVSVSVPDLEVDESPVDYWPIEVITDVPALRIASLWSSSAGLGSPRVNALLDSVVKLLDRTVRGIPVALDEDGLPDLQDLLRTVVRQRLATGILPTLYVGVKSQLVLRRTWSLLLAAHGSILFRYHAQPGQSLGRPSLIADIDGRLKLEFLDDKDAIRGLLLRTIAYAMPLEKGARPIVPPEYVVLDVLRYANQAVRPIDGLVRIPTIRPDGDVHDRAGYDAVSRLWYAPDVTIEPLPKRITDREIRRATATLLTPFREFPFVDEAGLAGTLACLLEQIVRPMITGPRPLFAFDAPAFRGAGTGKSLLPMAIGALITGRPISVTPWPDSSEEVAKVISSQLMEGRVFVVFDNLVGRISHPHLAALVTSTNWSPRTLHTMRSPDLAQNSTWCVTMNGATFDRDLSRRVVLIRLDARMADPFLRAGFALAPVEWMLSHRAEILRAALILVRGWVLAGRPPDPTLTWGSFEAWSKVVGGIVSYAGLGGLSKAIQDSRGRDTETLEFETLVSRWKESYGGAPVTAGQLLALAQHYALFAKHLETARTPLGRTRLMGDVAARMNGAEVAGVVVRRREALLHGHVVYELADPAPPQTAGAGSAGGAGVEGAARSSTLAN